MFAQFAVDDQGNQVRDRNRDEDAGRDAMDQAAHGVAAFQQQQRARPPLVGIFQGEAGPDQREERDRQHGVLDPLERAACGRRERGRG